MPMGAITIEAKSVGCARGLNNALIEFHPELAENENDRQCVSVELGTSGIRLLDVLNAIEQYVTEANKGPVRIDVESPHVACRSVAVVRRGGSSRTQESRASGPRARWPD